MHAYAPTGAMSCRPRMADGEIVGIPVHIEDRSGPLVVGLVFRVGWADEELHRRGLTHLVEHLALFGPSQTSTWVNGSVTPTMTSFVVRGQADEVVEFFETLGRALRRLPQERIATEARVLRTEGHGRRSVAAELLHTRFGSMGYGLGACPELGLVNPDPGEDSSHDSLRIRPINPCGSVGCGLVAELGRRPARSRTAPRSSSVAT
jgi:hypothetical protein